MKYRITAETKEADEYTETNPVDWEQRRYEIAKAAMVGQLAAPIAEDTDSNPSMAAVCKWSVMFADVLIDELKKSKHKNKIKKYEIQVYRRD